MSETYKDIALAKADDVLDSGNEFMFKVYNECMKWEKSEKELASSRSNFQIEKFVIHDNFTIPSAFKAAIINRKSVAEGLLQGIQEAKRIAREFHFKWDGKDKTQPIWWKNGRGGEELCWYDIDEFNFHRLIHGLNQGFQSQVDELEFFDKLIKRLIEMNGGQLITKEQYDADQPEYWERRLANQSLDDLLAARTGVNAGNIRSMRRASAPTVLPDDVNRTKGTFGDPTDPISFLNALQDHVAKGIEEISGLSNIFADKSEETKLIEQGEQSQPIPKLSLFNEKLKQNVE
jgi:hypothetical protein